MVGPCPRFNNSQKSQQIQRKGSITQSQISSVLNPIKNQGQQTPKGSVKSTTTKQTTQISGKRPIPYQRTQTSQIGKSSVPYQKTQQQKLSNSQKPYQKTQQTSQF